MLVAAGWWVQSCCLEFFRTPPSSRLQPQRISIPPTCQELIGSCIYMTPIRNTKCSLCQLKAFTSPHPRPPLHVLSPLTVCASLPIGNYPSVFLRFITISWPPQDVQTKWGIWICLLVCAREHLCTNTVVTGLTTHAQKKEMQAVQTHTHADNRIIMHKNKHARIHHADIQNTRTLVNTH